MIIIPPIIMDTNPHSCDSIRQETLEILKHAGASFDSLAALEEYARQVDERSGNNLYSELVKRSTKRCEKMANPRLWSALNPHSTNLSELIKELGLNWPNSTTDTRTLKHIEGIFNEIDQSFQKRGLKSSTVPGVNHYAPPKPAPRAPQAPPTKSTQAAGGSSNRVAGFESALEEHNPILDDERLKNIDKNIAERVLNEVLNKKGETKWADIAGLERVKEAINEIVVYPMLNPDLFEGILAPAKGLLLFGPPGTGKTMIGKCIASESGATFFSISASSLTSKWIGEAEKMVRALFAIANVMQPSVVFIDEIDSMLTQRTDGEHDSSRRMKTEFLVQFDGVATGSRDQILIVGATNRPQELDEAARRRFTKRLYIPLPDRAARRQIIETLLAKNNQVKSDLSEECVDYIVDKAEFYSGADMASLCKEAALGSLRSTLRQNPAAIRGLSKKDLPPIERAHFEAAFRKVKASVDPVGLAAYESWDRQFGEEI